MVDLPLMGRNALVTGVSRRRGIGFAVASRLAAMGASLALHHHSPHDRAEYGESDDLESLYDEVRGQLVRDARLVALAGDLGETSAPARLVGEAQAAFGHLDILVCNHAHGGDEVSIWDATPDAFDRHWTVNTRATLLLTQAFAAQHDEQSPGRVVWMTSGQGLGPMSDNLAYATSKAALAGATASVAADLAEKNVLLNTVNPGPVNTGYLDDAPAELVERFPTGRIGEPDDPARLIGWLVSDDARWVVGQVLNTEGGFLR
ncbi:MAG: SDR family oxidoreductase [Actinomycetia bacterium]|nr:SDR family oxidoreductase [Actinomycetes bacterium]